ncbi:17258_t:CDS:1, partial [Dentiscutata erythropus]
QSSYLYYFTPYSTLQGTSFIPPSSLPYGMVATSAFRINPNRDPPTQRRPLPCLSLSYSDNST